jgi:DNA-binding transcriptional regulator GbsR (MarR family)
VDWHLVRRTHVAGSRKDHYEAATDFWRVMQEIMERRFRWNLRQVLATVAETERTLEEGSGRSRRVPAETAAFVATRLETLRAFFAAVDAGLGAFAQGRSFAPDAVQNVIRMIPVRKVEK